MVIITPRFSMCIQCAQHILSYTEISLKSISIREVVTGNASAHKTHFQCYHHEYRPQIVENHF